MFGQFAHRDPLQCIAQGGIPDAQLGCVPSHLYPQVRSCVAQGGSWDVQQQRCITAPAAVAWDAYRMVCQAIPGASWDQSRMLCVAPGGTYTTSQLMESAQAGGCPSGQVMTPEGCQLAPGVLDCPPGTELTRLGCTKKGLSRDLKVALVGAGVLGGMLILSRIF